MWLQVTQDFLLVSKYSESCWRSEQLLPWSNLFKAEFPKALHFMRLLVGLDPFFCRPVLPSYCLWHYSCEYFALLLRRGPRFYQRPLWHHPMSLLLRRLFSEYLVSCYKKFECWACCYEANKTCLEKFIMIDFSTLELSLASSSRVSPVIGEVFSRQCSYHTHLASPCVIEIDSYTVDITV